MPFLFAVGGLIGLFIVAWTIGDMICGRDLEDYLIYKIWNFGR